jgi:predicted nuclease with TOPRIM domain
MTKEELQAAMEDTKQQFERVTTQKTETDQELFRLQGEYRVYKRQLAALEAQAVQVDTASDNTTTTPVHVPVEGETVNG